jgi:thymidylate synthase ThyX
MFITVIMTATELDNWFKLRRHKDAQPEIKWVADEMWNHYQSHRPRVLAAGEWHLPLLDFDSEVVAPDLRYNLCKVSAGRCARVSYLTHDGKRDMGEDVKLADRLMASFHWSPFEHVARALPDEALSDYCCAEAIHTSTTWSGNLRGWLQYRETVDTSFTRIGR